MVATGLIAVCVFFVLGVIPSSARSLRRAEELQAETAYAQTLLCDIRSTFPTSIQQFPYTDRSFTVQLNSSTYSAVREIRLLDSKGSYRLHEIVATVQRANISHPARCGW